MRVCNDSSISEHIRKEIIFNDYLVLLLCVLECGDANCVGDVLLYNLNH